jgi:hypothetical protein
MAELRRGASDMPKCGLAEKIAVVGEIRERLVTHATEWIEVSCAFKEVVTAAQRSEEILAGPSTTARYLTLLIRSLASIKRTGRPSVPARITTLSDGRLRIPVFPAQGVYDSLLFSGLRAEAWMQPDVTRSTIHGDRLAAVLDPPSPAPITLVLGAGNVSAIPLTDSLTKLFHEGQVVLLKMNPVNEALTPVFRKMLAPIIDRGWMQIVTGGADIGQAAMQIDDVSTVHITGSHHTHDKIVWGASDDEQEQRQAADTPLLEKPITSELGNVTPWIIVPGSYSNKQLRFQATNVAASMTNNAGFNCLTTRLIITHKGWSQREEFLDGVEASLARTPQRSPYYPGTAARFERFTGAPPEAAEDGSFPWLLMRDVNPEEKPLLFQDESFCSACVEIQLEANSPEEFLQRAADFCNTRLFGTLCATITMPNPFRRQQQQLVEDVVSGLNYGTVCINQWPGLVFGLMTPPWGAAPGSSLKDIQSGCGDVHNLYFLDKHEKIVLRGPLCNFPKPIWFPSHRRAEKIALKLIRFYDRPALHRLPGLFLPALLG